MNSEQAQQFLYQLHMMRDELVKSITAARERYPKGKIPSHEICAGSCVEEAIYHFGSIVNELKEQEANDGG